jgi:hypothetical protein
VSAAATSNPTTAATPGRTLRFETNRDILREINRLRHGGYTQRGNWSLSQMCYHISVPLKKRITPPATTTPTAEQAAMQQRIIEPILATGKPPPGMQTPPEMITPELCPEGSIEEFLDLLRQLDEYQHEYVDFGPAMGPVKTDVLRQVTKLHAAHHLAFLDPKHARRDLSFNSEDEVIADVENLRRGYVRLGGWTFEQVCWHLDKAVRYRMEPGPHPPTTPEQAARAGVLKQVLDSGKLPNTIDAPDPMVPPANPGPEAVDSLIQALRDIKNFKGEIAPHRIFGKLPNADARRLNLIHCAHHLSYLIPTAN